jgi:hypothetical protein
MIISTDYDIALISSFKLYFLIYVIAFRYYSVIVMTRNTPEDKKRKPRTKTPKLMRFTADTVRRLQAASERTGMSETVYTEIALKAQLKKDGIE